MQVEIFSQDQEYTNLSQSYFGDIESIGDLEKPGHG